MKLMNRIPAAILLASFVGAAACATAQPPKDLYTARSTYDRVSHGPSAQLAAADLQSAKESLNLAEKSFSDNGATQETSDLAYTATRRAELAEVHARTAADMRAKQQTDSQAQTAATANAAKTTVALGQANAELASQGRELQSETERRKDAEKRSAQAAADLAKFAAVKQDARGMVITLSGGVLFTSAKADLLPQAQLKLNDVANVLIKQDPDSKISVEGHTDSQGGAAYNQDLSQRRAQSVRDYLVSRGIAADRVSAQGFGSTRAVADNASPEGRADNRRVEIVVQGAQAPTASATP